MMRLIGRIQFMLKRKTWRRIAVCDAGQVVICHKGKEIKLNRRCPHQGLPLDNGYFQGDSFVCPWHGCRFLLSEKGAPRPFMPALHLQEKS